MISIAKDNEEEIMQPVIKKTTQASSEDLRAQEQANGIRDLRTLLNMLTDIALGNFDVKLTIYLLSRSEGAKQCSFAG